MRRLVVQAAALETAIIATRKRDATAVIKYTELATPKRPAYPRRFKTLEVLHNKGAPYQRKPRAMVWRPATPGVVEGKAGWIPMK